MPRARHRGLRRRGQGRPDLRRPRFARRDYGRNCPADQPVATSPPMRSQRSPRTARAIVVVELSAGQMVEDVRLAVEGRVPVLFHGRTGGMVPTPEEIVDALRRAWARTPARDGGIR